MPDVAQVGAEVASEVMALAAPQLELLGLPPIPASRSEVERRAKAGRPPGARNKRDEDVARFIIEHFGDPLLHQAAIATLGVDELAARLGCSPMEAAVEKRLAAAVVMPFLHSRKPLAVDLRQHGIVELRIVDGAGNATVPVGDGQVRTVEIEGVEYQYVADDDDVPV